MKHIITITHHVEAATWDLAVEEVMREPFAHMTDCRVKTPGKQLIHVTISIMKEALARMRATA
jgi:hypothetical protein